MGVKGLWQLLLPTGRRISIETLTGKRLAIDASIWITQFLKANRDPETGAVRSGAHIIGFLRRACKLLYHGILPVFVFDGATPEIKIREVRARRERRERMNMNLSVDNKNEAGNDSLKRVTRHILTETLKRQRQIKKSKTNPNDTKKLTNNHASDAGDNYNKNTGAFAEGFNVYDESNDGGNISGSVHEEKSSPSTKVTRDEKEHIISIDSDSDGNNIPAENKYEEKEEINDWDTPFVNSQEQGANNEELSHSSPIRFKYFSSNSVELDSDEISRLSPRTRASIIDEARRNRRLKSRKEFMSVASDPGAYSHTQLTNFLRSSLLEKNVRDVGKRVAEIENGRLDTNGKNEIGVRLASDATRRIIFTHDTDKKDHDNSAYRSIYQKKRSGESAEDAAKRRVLEKYVHLSSSRTIPEKGKNRNINSQNEFTDNNIVHSSHQNIEYSQHGSSTLASKVYVSTSGGNLGIKEGEAISSSGQCEFSRTEETMSNKNGKESHAHPVAIKSKFTGLISNLSRPRSPLTNKDKTKKETIKEETLKFTAHSFNGDKLDVGVEKKISTRSQKGNQLDHYLLNDIINVDGGFIPIDDSPVGTASCDDESDKALVTTTDQVSKSSIFQHDKHMNKTGKTSDVKLANFSSKRSTNSEDCKKTIEGREENNRGSQFRSSKETNHKNVTTLDSDGDIDWEDGFFLREEEVCSTFSNNDYNKSLVTSVNGTIKSNILQHEKDMHTRDETNKHGTSDLNLGTSCSSLVKYDFDYAACRKNIVEEGKDNNSHGSKSKEINSTDTNAQDSDGDIDWEDGSFAVENREIKRNHVECRSNGTQGDTEVSLNIGDGFSENNFESRSFDFEELSENQGKIGKSSLQNIRVEKKSRVDKKLLLLKTDNNVDRDGGVGEIDVETLKGDELSRGEEGENIELRSKSGQEINLCNNDTERSTLTRRQNLTALQHATITATNLTDWAGRAVKKAIAAHIEEVQDHPTSSVSDYQHNSIKHESMGTNSELDDLQTSILLQETYDNEVKETFSIPSNSTNPKSFDNNLIEVNDTLSFLCKEEEKEKIESNRRQRDADMMTDEMREDVIQLLQYFGIPYVEAPAEAEAQCVELERLDLVDGVVTDDSDALVFGAKNVYKNCFDDQKYVEVYLEEDAEKMGISREDKIALAMLLGGDYTEGVRGVGIVNGMEILQAFPVKNDVISGLHSFRKWLDGFDYVNLEEKKINNEPQLVSKKENFSLKHKSARCRWIAPKNFPAPDVFKAYTKPVVDSSRNPFSWGTPDLHKLKSFCFEKISWEYTETEKVLIPVIKQMKSSSRQTRLDSYFMRYEDNIKFAQVRSKRLREVFDGCQDTARPSKKDKVTTSN